MSPLLAVGHRLKYHGLHHRPLTARLSVIVICCRTFKSPRRSESTILALPFGGCAAGTCQRQAAQSGPSVGCPNLDWNRLESRWRPVMPMSGRFRSHCMSRVERSQWWQATFQSAANDCSSGCAMCQMVDPGGHLHRRALRNTSVPVLGLICRFRKVSFRETAERNRSCGRGCQVMLLAAVRSSVTSSWASVGGFLRCTMLMSRAGWMPCR
jgi:hypothetical protein